MSDYFDNYFFTSDVSGHTCPGFGSNVCKPPNACARDPNTGRRYCCDVKDVCWTITTKCATDGSTLDCGDGSTTWCCVDGREHCTAAKNQINICWSSHYDILNNITNKVLNNTYSSLSSAHPSATTWAFTPLDLIAQTAPPTSSASPTSSGASGTGNASPTSSSSIGHSPDDGGSSGVSGGAIAGIVVGSIAGVALIVAGLFFLWRRARNKNATAAAAAGGYQAPGSGPAPGGYPDGAGAVAGAAGANGLDDKPRYAGAPNFGAHDYANTNTNNSYYTGSPSPHPPPSSVPTSELHGDNVIPQELPASTAFGAIPSELSATSPSVSTPYANMSAAANSPAPAGAVPASESANVSPEQAYQRPYQASGATASPAAQ